MWSFFACFNTNTNLISFLDIANNQELLDRIQAFDETGELDVEFAKYSSSEHHSDFTGLAPLNSFDNFNAHTLSNVNHQYIFASEEQQLNWTDSHVIQIQTYFVNALSSLLNQNPSNRDRLKAWNEAF